MDAFFDGDQYNGSLYKKNYVYGAGMNLAWNELKEKIFHEDLQFAGADGKIVALAQSFNHPGVSRQDVDEGGYYVKAGLGQETVETINRELALQFPHSSFQALQLKLAPRDFIAYAALFQDVRYVVPFTGTDIFFSEMDAHQGTFEGTTPIQVRAFRAETQEQKANIDILSYADDQHFVLRLKLQQSDEEIILAKGFQEMGASQVVKMLQADFPKKGTQLQEEDYFHMPILRLDHSYSYDDFVGKNFSNKGFEDYMIASMSERILFSMDEKGAKIENQALMGAPSAIQETGPKPKYLFLDRPFWVMMKRRSSLKPYFILGVNTTDVMMKVF